MNERKLLVIPVTLGTVTFSTTAWIGVQDAEGCELDIKRSQIVGRQPEKDEAVMVLDIQDLVDALRSGDDDLVTVGLNGTVVRKTNKAVVVRRDSGHEVSLPKTFLDAEIEEYVSEVRLPRWLCADRGIVVGE